MVALFMVMLAVFFLAHILIALRRRIRPHEIWARGLRFHIRAACEA